MTRVINFWAGPGAGKSTMAAGLFYRMKSAHMKCELVTEYAKELVYEGMGCMLRHQLHVTTEQNKRQRRLVGKVDWIITDSPLLLGAAYAQGDADAIHYAHEVFGSYDNINFFVERVKPYQTYGRRESEESARSVDGQALELLKGRVFTPVPGDNDGLDYVFSDIQVLGKA